MLWPCCDHAVTSGSGYYDESEGYGQDLNSMYLAAYNGAQASMAWQFQQQMMGGMLMQMQQMQMQQRLQQAKAQRAREAALKQKAEKEAKAKAAKEAERAERERVRVAEAVMRLKNQQMGSMGSMSSMGSGSRANELPKQFGSLGSLGSLGSSLGSNELPNIGSILLRELNGFNSAGAPGPSASTGSTGSTSGVPSASASGPSAFGASLGNIGNGALGTPTLSSALGTLGSVGSVLSSASNAKPSAASTSVKGGDASSQSTKAGPLDDVTTRDVIREITDTTWLTNVSVMSEMWGVGQCLGNGEMNDNDGLPPGLLNAFDVGLDQRLQGDVSGGKKLYMCRTLQCRIIPYLHVFTVFPTSETFWNTSEASR